MSNELWAVHAQGPDEIYPAFDRSDAERHAAELNAIPTPPGILVAAVVIPSPWPASQHWQYLAEQEREHKQELLAHVAPTDSNLSAMRKSGLSIDGDESPSLPAAGSAELIAEAERCLFVLREIGSMDADDITGDDVDLRFEDEEGCDTGCDVSIVDYAEKSADVIEKMIAALSSHAAGSADFPPPDFALDGGSQPCYYAETVQRIVAALSAQQSAPWAPSGADYDRAIHRNPDAKAWADFFIATFPGQADKHDLMLGWFANAMMAMHDHLKAQQSAHVSVPREWLDAVKELFDAKQAKEDFERENPGNSTKRWDACLYRIDAAEDALRDLLNGGEA